MRETCLFRDRRGRMRCTECFLQEEHCVCVEPDERAFQRLSSPEGQFLRAVYESALGQDPLAHLFERIVSEIGMLGMHLVQNSYNYEVSDEEVRNRILRIGAALTLLATKGTPEYSFPSSVET